MATESVMARSLPRQKSIMNRLSARAHSLFFVSAVCAVSRSASSGLPRWMSSGGKKQ
jgi:hypothetical protein